MESVRSLNDQAINPLLKQDIRNQLSQGDTAMITKTQTDAVANIVRETLAQRFKDEFVFDPIIVESKIDHDGDKYLSITIVFAGDQKRLDAEWTLGLTRRIRPKLMEQGIDHFLFLSKSFVEKSEWEAVQEGRYFEPA